MKKVTLNTATDRTKRLVELLGNLEKLERDRISNDGKNLFDSIWQLLGLPTYDEIENYDDVTSADFDKNGTLIENEE
tara:strand:+ start:113 stop:343 length:231 start_codon:yes stop_codon:yes gene_type:complete